MKLLLVSCLVALAAADVSHIVGGKKDEASASIVRQDTDISPDGSYQWSYETENGIQANAEGQPKGQGEDIAVAAQGSYKYPSPEGQLIELQYVADENGFQPQGSHLPTPPPIPDYILRSLEFIKANPPKEQN